MSEPGYIVPRLIASQMEVSQQALMLIGNLGTVTR